MTHGLEIIVHIIHSSYTARPNLIDLPSNPKSTHPSPTRPLRCFTLHIAVHRMLFLPLLIFFVRYYCSIEVIVRLLKIQNSNVVPAGWRETWRSVYCVTKSIRSKVRNSSCFHFEEEKAHTPQLYTLPSTSLSCPFSVPLLRPRLAWGSGSPHPCSIARV